MKKQMSDPQGPRDTSDILHHFQLIPQTDLSVGVLAVLVRGLVIGTGHREAKWVHRFVVHINTKSIFLQTLDAF
jgi:hypothetical protein